MGSLGAGELLVLLLMLGLVVAVVGAVIAVVVAASRRPRADRPDFAGGSGELMRGPVEVTFAGDGRRIEGQGIAFADHLALSDGAGQVRRVEWGTVGEIERSGTDTIVEILEGGWLAFTLRLVDPAQAWQRVISERRTDPQR